MNYKIAVVSDLHFGIDDRFTENLKNRKLFVKFLQELEEKREVSQLVIAGDFLDEWYLPYDYPAYEHSEDFYRAVIQNNRVVFDQLKHLMESGIKLIYVPGNHDMLLERQVLEEALPGIYQARDAEGLGMYRTGLHGEIVIEHGHRYDVFSAPDSVSNQEITGDTASILPPGYFYARIAASWVTEGRPKVPKEYPVVRAPQNADDTDQMGAYLYYRTWAGELNRITPNEGFEDKVMELHVNGYDGRYSVQDIYPVMRADGVISAPLLYQNYQRSWEENQKRNKTAVPSTFVECVKGVIDSQYYFNQAKKQYLEHPVQSADIVVFGHTHIPMLTVNKIGGTDKYYVNSGTWIDDNRESHSASTYVLITSGEHGSKAELIEYN